MSGKKRKRNNGTPLEVKKAIAQIFKDKGQGLSGQERPISTETSLWKK